LTFSTVWNNFPANMRPLVNLATWTRQFYLRRRPLRNLLAILPLLVVGCSSSKAYVTAKCDSHCHFTPSSRISVAEHAHPRREEQFLHRALQTQLQQQGYQVTSPEQAEFTLTYWIEEAWLPGKQVVYDVPDWGFGPAMDPVMVMPPMPVPPGYAYTTRSTSTYTPRPRVVDAPFSTQGIRLKLFRTHAAGAERLRPAWEGYIEGGATVRARRAGVLLRTLFIYFGKDFTGVAPLVE
jgi:hypothetical protein